MANIQLYGIQNESEKLYPITTIENVENLNTKLEGIQSDLSTSISGVQTEFSTIIEGVQSDIDSAVTNIGELTTTIEGVQSDLSTSISGVQTELKNYVDDVKKTILGEGVTEAFDTLKEVETWISEHGTQAGNLIAQVNGIQTAVEDILDDYVTSEDIDSLDEKFETIENVGNIKKELNDLINGLQSRIIVLEGFQTTYEDKLTKLNVYATEVED